MCTSISDQGGSGGNKQFTLGYLVSVFLVGTFQGGMSQGNSLETWFMYTVFVKGNLYYIIYVFFVLFNSFFSLSFCFSYHDLSYGTLSLIIHLLVHYDASVYAPL